MQVSLETLSGLERRLKIEVPASEVDSQVQQRLQEAAKNFSMKGFRKGKVPLKVVKSRIGQDVRQEVVGQVMSQSYYEALSQEKVQPAGQPKIEPQSIEEGQDLAFTATFEVYPDIEVGDFSKIEVERKTAKVTEEDVDNMIETLRKQRQSWEEVDRESREGDQLDIDFSGTIGGEPFAGGEAKNHKLVLGSGSMIPGFEDGLTGVSKGEDKTLKLTFPKDYRDEDLAGKKAEFKVHVHAVEEPVLPELNKEFYASFGIDKGGKTAFRKEVKKNMTRELKNAVKNNVKTQLIDGLLENTRVELPEALIQSEIGNLKQQALQQFGGNANLDPSMLPDDMFRNQAEKRVAVGLIMNEVVQENELKADPDRVKELIEEMAEGYENPEEVVSWYYGNKDQLAQFETLALEDAVIEKILDAAQVTEQEVSYDEAVKPVESRTDGKPVGASPEQKKSSGEDARSE